VGALAAAWLIQTHGWRTMFVVLGLGALLWLLPWMLWVRDDRGRAAVPARQQPNEVQVPLAQMLKTPALWGCVTGTFCYMYFVYFCLTWMPAYFSEARGLSLGSSGLYTTFSFGGMALMSIVGGSLADRLIRRGSHPVRVRKSFAIAGLLLASTELIGGHSTSLDTSLLFAVLSLSGLGLATANHWALTQTLFAGSSIGRIIGVQNCAASLAGIVAPILTGWLVEKTGDFTAPMQMVLFFLAVGVAAYVFLVRDNHSRGGMTDRMLPEEKG